MQAHITLGRLCGIQIGLHYTWLLIAVLLLFSLAGLCKDQQPDLS